MNKNYKGERAADPCLLGGGGDIIVTGDRDG